MRVVGGRLGGRRLHAPPGDATRPTSDRVRESLFSILGPLDGGRVLDLFAGTGALGIEALSRGADHATFVERSRPATEALRRNLEALGLGPEVARTATGGADRHLRDAARGGEAYDLVFLDPPYRDGPRLAPGLGIALGPVLAAGARVVTESDRRHPMDLGLTVRDERRYGDTAIRIHSV